MRLTQTLCLTLLLIAAGASAATFKDSFDGKKLDGKAWTQGGSNKPLHTVRDGSLRLISLGQQNTAIVTTKQGDFDFFQAPLAVVWDLIPERTLAGPYPMTNFSKAYASLAVGSAGDGAAAQLALTAWPKGFPKPDPKTKWDFGTWTYTLTFGAMMPKYPNEGWAVSGVPSRIVLTLDKDTYTVRIEGAKFTDGDPAERTGKHELKQGDFTDGYHLKMLTSSHVTSPEPGAGKHQSGVLYVDDVCVTTPKKIPAAPKRKALPPVPTQAEVLKEILGGPAPTSVPMQHIFGVNYAGCTFRPKLGFQVPTAKSLDYFQSKGVGLMRLPFKWEQVQPELMGELDAAYIAAMKESIREMAKRGMQVIPDMHSYAQYKSKTIGSADVPYEAYTDVWRRLAEALKDEKGIWGYDLMNEPYKAGKDWYKGAQAGIDGVRAADKKTMIVVSGCGFSGTDSWSKDSAKLPTQLKDPSKNLCYQGHCYFDNNHAGKHDYSYEYEINRPNAKVGPMVGVERIRPFVEWLEQTGNRGLLGEFSVPANPDRDSRWLTVLDNVYQYVGKHNVPNTFWAVGTLWTPGRSYVIEPRDGQDRPQMEVLLKSARAVQKK